MEITKLDEKEYAVFDVTDDANGTHIGTKSTFRAAKKVGDNYINKLVYTTAELVEA